jgi:N utilization substance protein B
MQSRRACREAALQALYQCDALNDFSVERLEFFIAHFQGCSIAEDGDEQIAIDDSEYFHELARGIVANLAKIDSQIGLACVNWSVARMARVDRNIIRIAAFEMMHRPDVPPKVSINEAIEIAKLFAADDSPQFINGVLDRLSQLIASERQVLT